MKKLLSVVLSSALLLGLAAGCNSDSPTEQPAGSSAGAQETQQGTTAAEANIPDASPLDEDDPMKAIPQSEILAKVPKTEAKGTITVGDQTEPDEYIAGGFTNPSSNASMRQLIAGYATFTLDRNNQVVRDNVVLKDYKRIENPDKSVTYEMEINNNLKFSDGSPITAKNYVGAILIGALKAVGEIGGEATSGESLVGYKEYNEGDGTVPFKGVRLLGDYKFSTTISADELPNFYEVQLGASFGPEHLASCLGADFDVADDGQGAHLSKAVTKEYLQKQWLEPGTGWAFNVPVVAGPYKVEKFDKNNKALILKANKEYLSTFDGWKPQVETIVIKYSNNKTQVDELVNGTIDIMSPIGGKTSIDAGLAKMDASNGRIGVVKYLRNGFGLIQLQCDVGATKYDEVRQAITYSLDRNAFLKTYTGGYGSLVHASYGLAQGEYRANKKALEKELNQYPFDLNKAKELLEKGGWTLNEKGEAYTQGTRYKKTEDGKLIPLEIRWAKTDTPVTELLSSTLPKNLEQNGFKLIVEPTDFPQMLKAMGAKPGTEEREKYNMYVLATGFASISPHWYYTSIDPAYLNYNRYQVDDEKLRDIAEKMKNTKPGDIKSWNAHWLELQKRYNELMPQIPLYSDQYHLFYDQNKIKHLTQSSVFEYGRALIYVTAE